MTSLPVSIGIAGIGNVGSEVVSQLIKHKEYKKSFTIKAVSYRNKKKKRNFIPKGITYYSDAKKLAQDKNIDLVIELIGGSEGIAKDVCFIAIKNNKHLITANKALIAEYGKDLSELSNKNLVYFGFEASVAGGVPVIKVIKESLVSNEISQITGIMNGTSNYLMDEIEKKSIDFEKVLKTAQKLGYAEKDPTFDVEGIDAAHKLAILSLLVFKKLPRLSGMHVRGVSEVTLYDIKTARDFGYKIKLLAICSNQNSFECSVEPWLISKDHSLAKIDGVLNAIEINSNLAGPLLLTGAGAGSKPTASAVMSDVFDCLAGGNRTGILRNGDKINQVSNSKSFKSEVKFYLRVSVVDKVGILSDLTSIFKTFKISIETIYQDLQKGNQVANLIIFTHTVKRTQMEKAVLKINKLKGTVGNALAFCIYN